MNMSVDTESLNPTTPGELASQEILARIDESGASANRQRDLHGRASISMQKVLQDQIDHVSEELDTVRDELSSNSESTKRIETLVGGLRLELHEVIELIKGTRILIAAMSWGTETLKTVLAWGAPVALVIAGGKALLDWVFNKSA